MARQLPPGSVLSLVRLIHANCSDAVLSPFHRTVGVPVRHPRPEIRHHPALRTLPFIIASLFVTSAMSAVEAPPAEGSATDGQPSAAQQVTVTAAHLKSARTGLSAKVGTTV